VEPGTYTVTASLAGYASAGSSPFEVVAGETTEVPPHRNEGIVHSAFHQRFISHSREGLESIWSSGVPAFAGTTS
jgi:hypothetical protein